MVLPLEDVISSRVRGAARDMYLEKEPLRQKEQLTLPMVRALERFCCQASDFESAICGQLLFCVHSAARWSDSQHIKKMEVQRSEAEILLIAEGLTAKTTISQESKTRFLPYVAIGSGVKHPWNDAWISARENLGLTFGSFALPSWWEAAGKWTGTKMSSAEASGWLREFLIKAGVDEDEAFARSSHSCKATLTTWTSRCPVVRFSASEQRLVGHRMKPKDKSPLTYSRQPYTTLYGKVLSMFRRMRDGSYDPDLSEIFRVGWKP